jgi:hypothetical protein
MKRRKFFTLFGGAAAASVAGPLSLRAQQAIVPGFIASLSHGRVHRTE